MKKKNTKQSTTTKRTHSKFHTVVSSYVQGILIGQPWLLSEFKVKCITSENETGCFVAVAEQKYNE